MCNKRFISKWFTFSFIYFSLFILPAFSEKPQFDLKKIENTCYALSLKIPAGWHLYAPDTKFGLPLTFEETFSYNISSYLFKWPASKSWKHKNINSKTYKDTISIPLCIKKERSTSTYALSGKLKGALCKHICTPFSLDVSIKHEFPPSGHIFLFYLFLAFTGGIILNFMPCVWPVLTVKLRMLATKKENIKRKSLLTFSGIICFFNILALMALALHSASKPFLWGSHFQNTYFLFFLSIVMGLSGVVYLTKINLFHNIQKISSHLLKVNHLYDFYLGFLAAILASPCTAPFLTTSLAFSIGQSPLYLFLLFNTIALGYGFPYLSITLCPSLVKILPPPGKWLFSIEKIAGIILIIMSIWFGHAAYTSWHPSIETKKSISTHFSQSYNFPTKKLNLLAIQKYLEQGKKVFVITTAPWCITCKYNEYTVFRNKKIINTFSKSDLVVMVGVWEKNNKSVEEFLVKTNSPGVPTYIIYTKREPNGVHLSEIPSEKEILAAIKQ